MLKDSQLDLCGRVDFARTTPLLARSESNIHIGFCLMQATNASV